MVKSLRSYELPFSSYAQILCFNEAKILKKWSLLNFAEGFEFNNLKNHLSLRFVGSGKSQ